MSTKIYDGFRFAPGTDLFEIVPALADGLRKAVAHAAYDTLLLNGVMMLDLKMYMPHLEVRDLAGNQVTLSEVKNPFALGVRQYQDLALGMGSDSDTKGAEALIDIFTAEVNFLLHPRTRRVYGVPAFGAAVQTRALAVLKALPGYEDCPYWDNADADPTLTDEQWSERAKTWKELLPQHGLIASNAALTLSVYDRYNNPIGEWNTDPIFEHLRMHGIDESRRRRILHPALARYKCTSEEGFDQLDAPGIRARTKAHLDALNAEPPPLSEITVDFLKAIEAFPPPFTSYGS